MSLLYELGEGASEEALKPGSGALGQMALGALLPFLLLTSEILLVDSCDAHLSEDLDRHHCVLFL